MHVRKIGDDAGPGGLDSKTFQPQHYIYNSKIPNEGSGSIWAGQQQYLLPSPNISYLVALTSNHSKILDVF